MQCPNCNVFNDDANVFCVNCGTNFTQSGLSEQPPPTVQMPPNPEPQKFTPAHSVETSVLPQYQNYNQPFSHGFDQPQKKSNTLLWIGGILLVLVLLGGAGTAAYFVMNNSGANETLPGHFGLFSQNEAKTSVNELKKQDFINVLTAKDDFEKNENLPVLSEKPNFILFAENNDIPLTDLKLVRLDSFKDDGSFKQIDFQAAPVEGKNEMKRIRVSESLAGGKYAFALFDGYLEEGKHKFWAFEIKNDAKSDNGDLAKNANLPVKPKEEKPEETPEKTSVSEEEQPPAPPSNTSVSQPPSSRVAYLRVGNVVMRSGPSQNTAKIGGFRQGQKVYILGYSDNYESFQNYYSNYALVQTESGKRGWVYAAFLR